MAVVKGQFVGEQLRLEPGTADGHATSAVRGRTGVKEEDRSFPDALRHEVSVLVMERQHGAGGVRRWTKRGVGGVELGVARVVRARDRLREGDQGGAVR